MPQYDGYVRISTQNDTTDAQRSAEQLGTAIQQAMDTSAVDNASASFDELGDSIGGVQDGINGVGSAAISAGDIIRANLVSNVIMSGISKLSSMMKDMAVQSINTAQSNETAFAKASTLLTGELQQYKDGLMEISDSTGVAFTDLAESMYSALSAGVSQDSVLSFVEDSVKLSKGGFTQTATAIDIVTTALNAYHMEMSEAGHIQDVLITTQNKGKTTVDELASSMGKLIPTANGVNIEFDQLGAMYATVTANGVATAEATTYLNSMINELGKSGSTAEKAMMSATEGTELAGKKFSEISAMGYDVTDVLSLMDEAAQKSGLSLNDMFSSAEGAKAASILLSNIEGFKENIDEMANSAGAAQTAAETMMNTTAERAQIAKNQIDNLVTTIGEALLPVIGEAAEELSETADTDNLKEFVKTAANFASGTLTLLLKNIKLISSAIAGATAATVAFKAASVITQVIQSWRNAASQVNLFSAAEGTAALKMAATNGTLTTQEVIYAALSGQLDMATVKQYALNTAMSLNPAGAIAAVIGLLATAITGYALCTADAANTTKDYSKSLEEIKKKQEETINSGEAELQIVERKVARYEELRNQLDLNADETSELQGLAADLQSVFGDTVTVVDTLTGKYNSLSSAYEDYATKIRNNLMIEAKHDSALAAQKELNELQERYDELVKKAAESDDTYTSVMGVSVRSSFKYQAELSELKKQIDERQAIVDDYMDSAQLFGEQNSVKEYTSSVSTEAKTSSVSVPAGDYLDIESAKQKFKEQQKEIKHWYDMGEISAQEYYTSLQSMLDEYLSYATDSDEYRSAELEIKKYYDNLSADQKKAYEQYLKEQEQAAKQAEQEAKEAAQAQITAYNDAKSVLEYKYKTGKITEKKYYDDLAKIRDKYLDKNSKEWQSSFIETYQYNQKIVQANKDSLTKLLNDTADTTLSALQNITNARDSLAAKLTDFNKTFEKVTETVPETIAVKGEFTVTTAEHEVETYKMGAENIEDNIKVLNQYGDMLDALKARGADENTLNEIISMDVDKAMEFGGKLLDMSDKEWNSYFDSLKRLRDTADEIAAKYYQGEVDNLKNNFIDKLREQLFGLDSDMLKIGTDAALSFIDGWNKTFGSSDLSVNDMIHSLIGGTISSAPLVGQILSSLGLNFGSTEKQTSGEPNGKLQIPVYIGSNKLTDILIEGVNSRNIKVGKNTLNT